MIPIMLIKWYKNGMLGKLCMSGHIEGLLIQPKSFKKCPRKSDIIPES